MRKKAKGERIVPSLAAHSAAMPQLAPSAWRLSKKGIYFPFVKQRRAKRHQPPAPVASSFDSLTAIFRRTAALGRTGYREANIWRESPGNSAAISGSRCEFRRGYSVVSELRRIEPEYFLEWVTSRDNLRAKPYQVLSCRTCRFMLQSSVEASGW